ncbi:hypothetical protein IFM12275_26560 [Nocardia sputorum]|nr:hypothetical protein IFM12275_26560 [Nocardia sputorum]
MRDRRLLLRRGRGGRANASRAANGGCSVSLRSKDVVEVRRARGDAGSERGARGAGPIRSDRGDPSHIPEAVEEILRYMTVVYYFVRTAVADTVLGDVPPVLL